jgi:predicted nucleic acid-binding Zn ribbon protein
VSDDTGPGPDDTAESEQSTVDFARAVLAQARSRARERGLRPGQAGGADAGAGQRNEVRARAVARRAAQERSGAGPDARDPQPLGATIRGLVTDRGWQVPAAGAAAVGRWAEIVGAQIAEHCRADGFTDGVLTVVADSTAWATQVRLLSPQILHRLAEQVGAGTVTRIDVRGPQAPSWRRGPLSVRGRGPRDTYG